MKPYIHICGPTKPCRLALAAIEALAAQRGQHIVLVDKKEEPPKLPVGEVFTFKMPPAFPDNIFRTKRENPHFPNRGMGRRK